MNKINQPMQQTVNDSEHHADSLWLNLKYGLVMIAIIVAPLLIPGATVRLLIIGYMLVIIGIYLTAAVVAAIRTFGSTMPATRSAYRKSYR